MLVLYANSFFRNTFFCRYLKSLWIVVVIVQIDYRATLRNPFEISITDCRMIKARWLFCWLGKSVLPSFIGVNWCIKACILDNICNNRTHEHFLIFYDVQISTTILATITSG